MGVFIALGAFAKAVEPLWTRSTFKYSKLLCFGITCASQVLCILLSALFWSHLQPHVENRRMSHITLDEVTPEDQGKEEDESRTPSDHSEDSYMRDIVGSRLLPSPSR